MNVAIHYVVSPALATSTIEIGLVKTVLQPEKTCEEGPVDAAESRVALWVFSIDRDSGNCGYLNVLKLTLGRFLISFECIIHLSLSFENLNNIILLFPDWSRTV